MNVRIRMAAISLIGALALPVLALAGESVPTGTTISVTIDQSVSSKDAKMGQTVTRNSCEGCYVRRQSDDPEGFAGKIERKQRAGFRQAIETGKAVAAAAQRDGTWKDL